MALGDSPASPVYTAAVDGMADTIITGTITTQNLTPTVAATAGSAVEISCAGRDTLGIQVVGTYTGALSLQATLDGTNWITLGGNVFQKITDSVVSATIPTGVQSIFTAGIGGYKKVRLTALAAVTGTATITLIPTDGTNTIALDSAIPAGSAVIGAVTISGTPAVTVTGTATVTPTTGTAFSLTTAATTNATSIKASAGNLHEITVANVTATAIFVKLYNKASAPTVGTDVPILTIPVAANSVVALETGPVGKRFSTGIALAATALIAATDTGVAVAGVQISGTYL